MASNEFAEQAQMVEMVTGFENRTIIINALRENNKNVDTVVNEYLDDPAKVGGARSFTPSFPSMAGYQRASSCSCRRGCGC